MLQGNDSIARFVLVPVSGRMRKPEGPRNVVERETVGFNKKTQKRRERDARE